MAIENLPRFAETHFNRECAKHGATCHSASEDETGWDFLIEIDDNKILNHEAKELISAYIQVKSATAGKMRCKIKLSNALNSCRSPHPWFIFFISEKDDSQKFYIKHFDKSLIERSLKRIWQSSIESKSLNKQFLYITFNDEDEIKENVISFIKETTKEGVNSYRGTKGLLFETLGREETHGTGTVSVKAESLNSFYKELLGIGNGLSEVSFQFYNERFGVGDKIPHIDIENGILEIHPLPAGKCKTRITNNSLRDSIEMKGLIYPLNVAGISIEDVIIRFSTDFMEIIHPPIDGSGVSINFNFLEKYNISTIKSFSRLMSWSNEKNLHLEIWTSSSIILEGNITINSGNPEYDWHKISILMSFLEDAFNTTEEYISLEMQQIIDKYKYIESARLLSKSDLIKFYMEDIVGEWSTVKYSVYFIYVNIGDYDINLIIERDCLLEIRDSADLLGEGTKFCATVSNPKILEFSITDSDNGGYGKIENRYNKIIKRYEEDHILTIGDAMKLIDK